MIETMSSMLMSARHMQIMEIYHSECPTEDAVNILHLITEVLERQLKLEPQDHVGKQVIIIDPMFEEYTEATITWQDLGAYNGDDREETFTLYYQNSETGGFTRKQFRFVGGD